MERDQEKILQILNRTMSLAGSVNKKASRQSRQYQDKLRNCEYLLRDEIQIEQVILIPKIIQLCSRSIENEGL
jgi:hypothetical protein